MFVACPEVKEVNFAGYSLILPAISIGNVGQLSVDLLLYNIPFKKVGYLYDSSLLSLIGNDPLTLPEKPCGTLVTNAEVYKCDERKLIVVQIRAPIAKGCRQMFCERMVKWIKECQFNQTILLTSCMASERLDSQIQRGPFRFLLSPETQHLSDFFIKQYDWIPLEQRWSVDHSVDGAGTSIFLPGGGVSKCFYETCCRENISLIMLLVFCAEGDNIPDAMTLLDFTNMWLQIQAVGHKSETNSKVKWRQPPSWNNLYGTSDFSSIF